MGDVGRHHLGGQPGARLHLGQLALGLFKGGVACAQLPVGLRQPFGMGQHLARQLFGPGPQQAFLQLHLGDVGIDRHPAAL